MTPCLTNTHIHTNYSFSVFESPAQAVEQAVSENIGILGINDHYTIAGYDEFRAACAAHAICPMFSMEAVALDVEMQTAGKRVNDPNNPGRCYLTAKSVTRALRPGSRGDAVLKRMRAALTKRNEQLVGNLNTHLASVGAPVTLSMKAVEALTPAGNTTERHVIQHLAESVLAQGNGEARALFTQLCGAEPPAMDVAAKLQDFLRGKLVKAGCPDYAPEVTEAFESLPDMVELYLEMGAIPTYPILGNPVTEAEEDVAAMFKRLEGYKIFAYEVIPNRNTPERILDIVKTAGEFQVPIFTGTEHNTKTPGPLVDKYSNEEPFKTAFFNGALVALGHAAEVKRGNIGYVRPDGSLRFTNRAQGLAYFMERGREVYGRTQPAMARA
ncbi:PHP domain-containing protein [bacterium]|nr:PHP domain-containing protein [bacterium]